MLIAFIMGRCWRMTINWSLNCSRYASSYRTNSTTHVNGSKSIENLCWQTKMTFGIYHEQSSICEDITHQKQPMRFGKKWKLRRRFISNILERVGHVAYKLEITNPMDRVHNVFHILILTKICSQPIVCTEWSSQWITTRFILRRKFYWDFSSKNKVTTEQFNSPCEGTMAMWSSKRNSMGTWAKHASKIPRIWRTKFL